MADAGNNSETETRAILFADIEGYTRLMSEDQTETHRNAMRCLELLKDAVEDSDGRLVNTTGDGAKFEFPTAPSAVQFAIDIQAKLVELNKDLDEDKRPKFRIGVNLGEIIRDGDDIYGHSVNVAARIEQFSEPNGICVTRIVYDLVRSELQVGFESIGFRTLKNVPEPVEIFRVRADVDSSVQHPSVRTSKVRLEVPNRPSIAVLAFQNGSPDTLEEYFLDGVTEDIIANLSRFEELFVIARNSSFVFKGANVSAQDVAREMGVRYVLQGTARRAGDRLRINTELTDAASGRNVWSEMYDRDFTDIFDVQDEIVQLIVGTLASRLQIEEIDRGPDMATENLNAYQNLLHGREQLVLYNAEANARARQFFVDALEYDPRYSPACAGIARTYNYAWQFAWGDGHEDALDEALDWANKAVQYDRSSARGHAERGFTLLFQRKTEAAIQDLRNALKLNPNDADIMAELSDALTYDGQVEEAVHLLNQAMRLNPYHPDRYLWYMADAQYALRQYDESIEALHRMTNEIVGARLLAASYAMLNRMNEAHKYRDIVMEQSPDFSVSDYMSRQPDTVAEAAQEYVDGLLKAGLPA